MHKITLLILAFTLALSGCGGGGGGAGGGANAQAMGDLTLIVTDGVIENYQQALLTVTAITLIGDDGKQTKVLNEPFTLDLLSLRNVSEVLAKGRFPAGTYSKIRLMVARIELNKLNAAGDVIDTDVPKLPANGKVDLNPRSPFVIRENRHTYVEIDVDLDQSIKVIQTGNGGFRFRPVVFVKVLSHLDPGRLVRLFGTIRLGASDTDFDLCRVSRLSEVSALADEFDGCLRVTTDDATSLFGTDAQPIRFGQITDGDQATVYGRFDVDRDADILGAEVVALGGRDNFTTLKGLTQTGFDPDTRRYQLAVGPGQGLADGTEIAVELSDTAKVYDRAGNQVRTSAIVKDIRASAEGQLNLSNTDPDWLQAYITFVAPINDAITVVGTLEDIKLVERILILDVDGSEVCVQITDDTMIYEVNDDGERVDAGEISLDDLQGAPTVEVTGKQTADCILARVVIFES